MKEFGFYNTLDEPIVLNEQIEISNDLNAKFLISNSDKLKADIVAHEIDFYLKNTLDDTLTKAKNTLLLYEARASAFDLAKDVDYKKKTGKNILVVSNSERKSLDERLSQGGYKSIWLNHFEIKFVYGSAGELGAIVLKDNEEYEIEFDFMLVNNAQNYMLKQSGCIEISTLSDDEILAYLDTHHPIYSYKSYIHYDQSICQYHERRHEICAKCADVCPSVAILKDDETKHLVFSHIDCVDCGECVGVCPSGAIDYSRITRQSFAQIARMYKGKIPLVVPNACFDDVSVSLPSGVLPFGAWSEKFLSEAHLLTLLQESGSSVVIYSPSPSRVLNEAVLIINQIYELKFKTKAIYVARDEDTLRAALDMAKIISGSEYSTSEYALPKREIFSKRLSYIVGDGDLGEVYTDELIRYGKIEINRDTCTLCLSCVGACNVNALIADKASNSIKFNPSICTACGYCELSCAEKDTLFLHRGVIELKPQSFTYTELARDELFKCVECGKEFATKKAVEKIATLMAPKFADYPEKIKTLYCCSDCKAKVMIKAQILARQNDFTQ
ncbi:Ferredoxin-type protein NapF [Campylobacter majalis]|uniref:Ferredoxin-type protein NapF n=1 Tax=Campylobacter majalis TaxID=2790656 RepID=A0ABM8Q437_9BACT|nr:4Fe-4S binding protein [Campylobacter majalis]CAD7287511.1 Ferredoxin-type protein NapF [Campylobacter majalis]